MQLASSGTEFTLNYKLRSPPAAAVSCAYSATPSFFACFFIHFFPEFHTIIQLQEMAEGEWLIKQERHSVQYVIDSYCEARKIPFQVAGPRSILILSCMRITRPCLTVRPHAAPAGDKILTESDAVNILEELTEAVRHAVVLGVMLSIKPVELEAISKM